MVIVVMMNLIVTYYFSTRIHLEILQEMNVMGTLDLIDQGIM